MSDTPSFGNADGIRDCPQCRSVVVDATAACPGCGHPLRAGDHTGPEPSARRPDQVPLHVEGQIRQPDVGGAWEYAVVVAVRDGSGREIARHVVDAGALGAGEERNVAVRVEVFETGGEPERRH